MEWYEVTAQSNDKHLIYLEGGFKIWDELLLITIIRSYLQEPKLRNDDQKAQQLEQIMRQILEISSKKQYFCMLAMLISFHQIFHLINR